MLMDFASILLPECFYFAVFVLLPIGLLILLWQSRKIQTLRMLLFLGGLFLSIGILSFYFLAEYIGFSPFLFTVINYPLFVLLTLTNKYLNINFDQLYTASFIVIPFLVYPFIGFLVGAILDKLFCNEIKKELKLRQTGKSSNNRIRR